LILHYTFSYYEIGIEYTGFKGTELGEQICQLYTIDIVDNLMCAMKCTYITSCLGYSSSDHCSICVYSPKCKTTNFSSFDHIYFKSLKPAPGYLLAETDKELLEGFSEYESCITCLTDSGNFCKVEMINMTEFRHVSAGKLGVWAIDALNKVYYQRYDSTWILIQEDVIKIKQIDVGIEVWGISTSGTIYVRDGITRNNPIGTAWKIVDGWLLHVTITSKNNVWGVNDYFEIYYRNGSSLYTPGNGWKNIGGYLMQISAGPSGVWGVNKYFDIYYKPNTYGDEVDSELTLSNWIRINGGLFYLSVGDNIVWGLNTYGYLYYRKGISCTNPIGTEWVNILSKSWARKIEVYKNHIWLFK
jgi:hypothetical protein